MTWRSAAGARSLAQRQETGLPEFANGFGPHLPKEIGEGQRSSRRTHACLSGSECSRRTPSRRVGLSRPVQSAGAVSGRRRGIETRLQSKGGRSHSHGVA